LQIIADRETSKVQKYKNASKTHVYPLVFDTFGNRGRYVDTLLQQIKSNAIIDQQNFMKLARQELTFSLHRAAARCAYQSANWISANSNRHYAPPAPDAQEQEVEH
jgi:hypothetical protein